MALKVKSAQYQTLHLSTMYELDQLVANLKSLLEKNYALTIKCGAYLDEDDGRNLLGACWRPSDINGSSLDRTSSACWRPSDINGSSLDRTSSACWRPSDINGSSLDRTANPLINVD